MKKVLIVDDAPTVLKIVDFTLTSQGYEVVQAGNANEAMDRVREERPEIGIFDVNMPGKSGIELTRDVLSSEEGRDMKVVMLTTESSAEMKDRGREAGAVGWLVKPFQNDDLLSLVSSL